jgi:hypothetical protein
MPERRNRMATKKELLDEFTEAGLRELAVKHNVELQGESEEDIREEVANSAITKAEIETYSAKVDRQEGAAPASDGTAGQDPMLANDVDEQVAEAAKGTSTDAASRVAGTTVDEVDQAPNYGDKPTDETDEEGNSTYDFPPQGDVEVLTVEETESEGELIAPLEVEDAVILGEHELVPDRLVGRRAHVIEAPRGMTNPDKLDETWVTVKTRDEVNAQLVLPMSAFKEIQKGGLAVQNR